MDETAPLWIIPVKMVSPIATPANAMPVKLDALPCTVNAPTSELIELIVGKLNPPIETVEPQMALARIETVELTRDARNCERPTVASFNEMFEKTVVSPLR
jgi:hypothetical protein